MDSAQTDTVSERGQAEGEGQFNRKAPKYERSMGHPELWETAASHQVSLGRSRSRTRMRKERKSVRGQ